jgi:3-oxoacyl-[acyl-carrier-protein] synthase-3
LTEKSIGILGVGKALPDNILTNSDLEKMVDTSDVWITSRTGIKERRIATEEVACVDLAEEASRRALAAAGIGIDQIDLIVVASATPDMVFPSTACLLQARLGVSQAAAFDVSAGCSGFVYGLDVAWNMLKGGNYQYALLVGADLLSRITDFTDRSTCVLFGDGAGAVVLGPAEGRGIIGTHLGADGSGGTKLYISGKGFERVFKGETSKGRDGYISMAGNDVFKFAVRIIEEATLYVLNKAGMSPQDIDLFIPHQANIRIIDSAVKRLDIPENKVVINVDKYGNTSAASIPIAISEAYESGSLKPGMKVILVGFGAGLTWASALVEW